MNEITVPAIPASNGFDYSALSEATATRVQNLAVRIRGRINDSYIETGRDLISAKIALGHGAFGKWREAEFGWSERTAQNLMNAARLVDGKSANITELPAVAIYQLAAPSLPEKIRDGIIARVENGETMSVKEVKTRSSSCDRAARPGPR